MCINKAINVDFYIDNKAVLTTGLKLYFRKQ